MKTATYGISNRPHQGMHNISGPAGPGHPLQFPPGGSCHHCGNCSSYGQARKVEALAAYKAARMNGDDRDNPKNPFPNDGHYSWEGDEHWGCAVRYTEGPATRAWMEEKDRNYVFRLLKEERLETVEPNLKRELPALYAEVERQLLTKKTVAILPQLTQLKLKIILDEIWRDTGRKIWKDRLAYASEFEGGCSIKVLLNDELLANTVSTQIINVYVGYVNFSSGVYAQLEKSGYSRDPDQSVMCYTKLVNSYAEAIQSLSLVLPSTNINFQFVNPLYEQQRMGHSSIQIIPAPNSLFDFITQGIDALKRLELEKTESSASLQVIALPQDHSLALHAVQPPAFSQSEKLDHARQAYKAGNYQEALRLFTDVLEEDISPSNLYDRGVTYMALENYKDALEDLNQAQTLGKDSRREIEECNERLARSVQHLSASVMLNDPNEIRYKDIVMGKRIGVGAFGVVHQATWRNQQVAVKTLAYALSLEDDTVQKFREEGRMHLNLNHKNIVPLYGICAEEDHYCLVMELAYHGSLYAVLHSATPLPWSLRLSIVDGIVAGLQYLHDVANITHRDLKSHNILVNESMQPMLTDFGFAKFKDNAESSHSSHVVGTALWKAPEVIAALPNEKIHYTKAVDIYGFSMVCLELITRDVPFANQYNPVLVPAYIIQGKRPAIPDRLADTQEMVPNEFRLLMARCWADRAEDRPQIREVAVVMASLS